MIQEDESVVTKVDVADYLRQQRDSNKPIIRANDKRIQKEKALQAEKAR